MNWLKENEFLTSWILFIFTILIILREEVFENMIELLTIHPIVLFAFIIIVILIILFLVDGYKRKKDKDKENKKEEKDFLDYIASLENKIINDIPSRFEKNEKMLESILNQKQKYETRLKELESKMEMK